MDIIFKELTERYTRLRLSWIYNFGTDEGFNEWFRKLVLGN